MKSKNINKLILFILLNISSFMFSNVDITQKGAASKIIKREQVFYTGIVKMPTCKNTDIELCMCYNGDIIKVKRNDNLFMIKDNIKDRINILFTSAENFSVDSQDNTILFFKLDKKHTPKFYKLLKKLKMTKDSTNKFTWEITETDLPAKEDKIFVPLDTLIIPIDPDKIEISFNEVMTKQTSKVINLPTIVIEGQAFCNLEEQMDKSCIAFMNIKPFHAMQNKREVRQDNLKVCLVN
ncbi:MAG: hypothetical protein P4L22_00325 [Candidatus Babeliales bacterium]|nr:hypothetical protein [Candidatus Babeliales bacterium]